MHNTTVLNLLLSVGCVATTALLVSSPAPASSAETASGPIHVTFEPLRSIDPVTGSSHVATAFLAGEPIRLHLSIRNPTAALATMRAINEGLAEAPAATVRIAPPGVRWSDFMTTRFYRKDDSRKQEVLPGFNWRSGVYAAFAEKASLNDIGSDRVSMPVIVPPAVTASLAPGTYAVEAVFDNTRLPVGAAWRGRLASKPFEFSVREAKTPGERSRVLARQSEHAHSFEVNLEKAHDLALQATQVDPGSSEAWYRLGYALWSQKKPGEAIQAFERVLALLGGSKAPGHVEIVDSVRRRIGDLRRQIGKP